MKIDKAIGILKNGEWWGYLDKYAPRHMTDELCYAVRRVANALEGAPPGSLRGDPPAPTNADRIRAMSDDELAKKCLHLMGAERITANRAGGGYHIFFGPDGRVKPYDDAFRAWLDWLQQPAEEK